MAHEGIEGDAHEDDGNLWGHVDSSFVREYELGGECRKRRGSN